MSAFAKTPIKKNAELLSSLLEEGSGYSFFKVI